MTKPWDGVFEAGGAYASAGTYKGNVIVEEAGTGVQVTIRGEFVVLVPQAARCVARALYRQARRYETRKAGPA